MTWREIAELYSLAIPAIADNEARPEIFPTHRVAAVLHDSDDGRVLRPLHWGLLPFWAKDRKIASSLINARGETVATKPAFRAAFKRRRCLLPATGFFEWKKIEGQKKKERWLFQFEDAAPFAFAGLWETWNSPEGEYVESCTIITTAATSPVVARLHDRQPAIVPRDTQWNWLNPEIQDTEQINDILQSCYNYEITGAPHEISNLPN